MEKITALIGNGQTHPKFSQSDISIIRKAVISGNWTAINKGIYTLTDLGLRHNGQGLVWLNSGISVHDAECDTELTGKAKASFDYHASLCPINALENNDFCRGVHPHKVDSYCLLILSESNSWVEYWHRKDGKALTTFAVQVLTNERQEAFDNWFIYRHPTQQDKYTVINAEKDKTLVQEYIRHGWLCESAYELSLLVKNNIEFGRLMARLGYIKIRTAKITGHKETFWVYRSAEKGLSAREKQPCIDASYARVIARVSHGKQSLCPYNKLKNKGFIPFAQYAKRPVRAFEHIAVDGQWLYVYADHIRFLTKKRHRVEGVRVQGYTAKGIELREVK
ncbi:hypothetical protein KKJ25_17850 [Xenorhabdus bovienii]|uniref:hypothetical protein n=1 Tax=Xenorhabdus bovienii TaxID=40576 RepID=UPI00237CED0E|nr:hypothetical protein [Xenorhabdus bovienii]MDE1496740.1 hypothetical protein [Xenorhabdus bovienii]MDE9474689.1 hypothetical protein [Xenorhabdus bovienii]